MKRQKTNLSQPSKRTQCVNLLQIFGPSNRFVNCSYINSSQFYSYTLYYCRVTCTGSSSHAPAELDTGSPSISLSGSGEDYEHCETQDTREPLTTTSTINSSSSSLESSDNESGSEQPDATTTDEPLVDPLSISSRETSSSTGDSEITLHPAVSSGDLHLVQSLKQEWCLTDREKHFILEHSFVPSLRYTFPSRTISGTIRHFSTGG